MIPITITSPIVLFNRMTSGVQNIHRNWILVENTRKCTRIPAAKRKARFNDLKNQIKSMCLGRQNGKNHRAKDWLTEAKPKQVGLAENRRCSAKESAGFSSPTNRLTSLAGIAFSPSSGLPRQRKLQIAAKRRQVYRKATNRKLHFGNIELPTEKWMELFGTGQTPASHDVRSRFVLD